MDYKPNTPVLVLEDIVRRIGYNNKRGIVIKGTTLNDYQVLVEFGDGERIWFNKGNLREDASVTGQTTHCPKCGSKWDDGDIYDRLKELHPEYSEEKLLESASCYGWSPDYKLRFSRLVGITDRDRLSHYQCPDCRENFKRAY